MDGVARIDSAGKGIIYIDMYRDDAQQKRDVLRTSRGGEYSVYLSDGSVVYLNADTQLEYLVPFDVDKREVKLSGEAYFEVAKETGRPFSVIVDGVRIQVYGTTFTVNTRKRERIQTVLVKGSIGIQGTNTGEEIIMTPGQLSLFSYTGELLELKEVNTYPYFAWKDGKFIFEEEELEYIMQTLSLWYDVDVVYQDDAIKHHLFTGHLKKYDDIDTILNAISQIISVNFELNERVITIKSSR
jgi:ferric-dicitrate binding protein FerR (iron transport regulator)